MTQPQSAPVQTDWPTIIAISALALILETALHEHLGHAGSCLLLGSYPTELGAFYVNCNYTGMSDLAIRLVALAGPVVSLLTGVVSFLSLRQISPRQPALYYFVWLLGTIGFMTATGYLLFSGVSGIGDFGLTRDGALYSASPAWLWQTLMSITGLASYFLTVRLAVRTIEPYIGGVGRARITYARHLVLASYLTGVVVAVGIGFLNPYGVVIVLTSAAASTLGGTSGFLWMMQLINLKQAPGTLLTFRRSWSWIMFGAAVTVVYALVLGPTVRP